MYIFFIMSTQKYTSDEVLRKLQNVSESASEDDEAKSDFDTDEEYILENFSSESEDEDTDDISDGELQFLLQDEPRSGSKYTNFTYLHIYPFSISTVT